MAVPTVGQVYIYDHPANAGYGEMARGTDLTAEMMELDLKDGALVKVDAIDEATGWPMINWTDSTGIDRRTTIDQAHFDAYFVLQP